MSIRINRYRIKIKIISIRINGWVLIKTAKNQLRIVHDSEIHRR